MLKRIAVLVALLLAVGVGSMTSSACTAPQASKLLWAGEPTQPDDYGDPERSIPLFTTSGEPTEPSEGIGDPSQPRDGLVWNRFRSWLLFW